MVVVARLHLPLNQSCGPACQHIVGHIENIVIAIDGVNLQEELNWIQSEERLRHDDSLISTGGFALCIRFDIPLEHLDLAVLLAFFDIGGSSRNGIIGCGECALAIHVLQLQLGVCQGACIESIVGNHIHRHHTQGMGEGQEDCAVTICCAAARTMLVGHGRLLCAPKEVAVLNGFGCGLVVGNLPAECTRFYGEQDERCATIIAVAVVALQVMAIGADILGVANASFAKVVPEKYGRSRKAGGLRGVGGIEFQLLRQSDGRNIAARIGFAGSLIGKGHEERSLVDGDRRASALCSSIPSDMAEIGKQHIASREVLVSGARLGRGHIQQCHRRYGRFLLAIEVGVVPFGGIGTGHEQSRTQDV